MINNTILDHKISNIFKLLDDSAICIMGSQAFFAYIYSLILLLSERVLLARLLGHNTDNIVMLSVSVIRVGNK